MSTASEQAPETLGRYAPDPEGAPLVRVVLLRLPVLLLVEVLGRQYATARSRGDQEIDEAVGRGELVVDQVTDTPATAAVALLGLQTLLGESDEFSRRSMLLTNARSPLLRRFSDWYTGQFIEQIDGLPARPWDGPLQP